MRLKLPHNITLRHYQRELFRAYFVHGKKRLVQVIHRRAGKDYGALNLCLAILLQRVGYCLYLFPEQTQARKVIWNGMTEEGVKFLDAFPPELIASVHNSDMRVTFVNGSIFQLGGADRYDALRGTNPIVLVFSEYSQADPGAWPFLSPILRKNKGVAIFCYTPFGQNHGYNLYETNKDNPDWFCQYLTVKDTHTDDGMPIISEEDIEKDRRAGVPRTVINQEYYLDWYAPLPGAFYVDEITIAKKENRIRDLAIDLSLHVITSWDLGISDATAIWFAQVINKEIRFIHYYENRNKSLAHYVDYLHQFAAVHKIRYSYHFAPHDIQVRELGTGKSRLEVAAGMGIRFTVAPVKLGVIDGIEQVRILFSRFWFNDKECSQGLNALRSYHREYDQRKDVYQAKPLHDWSSHAADAIRYFAICYQEHLGGTMQVGAQLNPAKFKIF